MEGGRELTLCEIPHEVPKITLMAFYSTKDQEYFITVMTFYSIKDQKTIVTKKFSRLIGESTCTHMLDS
jgi:hypothetical protein